MSGWDGFYAAYMSGSNGQGFVVFVFSAGVIVGADPLGVNFDGVYKDLEDGSLEGNVTVTVPGGGTVIQGASAGPAGFQYDVPLSFASNALEVDFIRMSTPLGPVNVRLRKLRDLASSSG